MSCHHPGWFQGLRIWPFDTEAFLLFHMLNPVTFSFATSLVTVSGPCRNSDFITWNHKSRPWTCLTALPKLLTTSVLQSPILDRSTFYISVTSHEIIWETKNAQKLSDLPKIIEGWTESRDSDLDVLSSLHTCHKMSSLRKSSVKAS